MKRTLYTTADGSTTLHIAEWNEQYHSKHGAINEAQHVFINAGLHYWKTNNEASNISIMEIGFGTGLNALLSLVEAEKHKLHIDYTGIEAYPLGIEEIEKLNYSKLLDIPHQDFIKLHEVSWEKQEEITSRFHLSKQKKIFSDIKDKDSYDIIFFDAFGIRVQPELWTESIFKIMFKALRQNGILVTYAANGSARRAMKASGFEVTKLPGPPGKREMLRAVKI